MKKLSLLSLTAILLLTGCTGRTKNLTLDQAKERSESFINLALMAPGTQATITEVEKINGSFRLTVDTGTGDSFYSYLTLDGQVFFPQGIDIDEITSQLNLMDDQELSAMQTSVSNQTDKPVVELFSMSYCPYGLQMQRGLLPVVEKLADKIDFQIKFCDYAMNDKPEIDENLTQYCIQKDQPDKLIDYLTCFMQTEDSESCYQIVGLDIKKLENCIASTDKEYKITEAYNDEASWESIFPPFDIYKTDNEKYGVQGSPTLVINGENISTSRDSASLLAVICSAFNEQPEECQVEMSSDSPTAGFGVNGVAASEAECN